MTLLEAADTAMTDVGRTGLVRAFGFLLQEQPDAIVAALGRDGLITEMPPTVPLVRHRVAVARSVLDTVVPADKVRVISAWERTRRDGGASLTARLVTDPDQPVQITFVDATAEYGVILAMMLASGGSTADVAHHVVTATPKTARMTKTEVAMITAVDRATTQILGWQPQELIGRRSLELIHPEDRERAISNWMEMLTAPGHEQRVRLRHETADGRWVWLEVTNRNLLHDPLHRCVATEMIDVSDELGAQDALRASEQRLRRLAEALPLGIVQIEQDHRISYANERLAVVTGAALARSVDEQFRHVARGDRARLDAALQAVLADGIDRDVAVDFVVPAEATGDRCALTIRRCAMSMRSLTDEGGVVTGAIVSVADVSEQVRMTAELEHRATFDALTGCYNRAAIMCRLDRAIANPSDGVAIVFIDLDDFKSVNDDRGHVTGDAVLAAIGALLRNSARDGDLIGRIGGDEFLVVCPAVADIDEAFGLAARLDTILRRGLSIGGETIVQSASFGVAHTTDTGTTSDRLVADADLRMYADKRERKSRTEPGAVDRPQTLRTRLGDEAAALRAAIRAGELELHFQPIVTLPGTDHHGLETLVRWRRNGEVIPAAAFIDVAERTGLITEIGQFVLDTAIRTAATAPPDTAATRWFVNMSPLELARPCKVADLRDALDRYRLDPSRLVIEVTEHSELAANTNAVRAIHDIADLGVAIALDDFGTGHSSLSLLQLLPVSYLKFDRSFTAGLGEHPLSDHLLDTCAEMTRRLGISLIVEGVETVEQREHLIGRGIELAQGYLFSVPQPLRRLYPDAPTHR